MGVSEFHEILSKKITNLFDEKMGFIDFIFRVTMEEQIFYEMMIKFGVVVALSLGFLFIHLRNQRIHGIRSLLPSHSGKKIAPLDESFDLENYVEALQEANEGLRKENDELGKEIDRLEANQCAFFEEQVYLKWLNACLRYEMRNFKAPPGKTMAKDLNKNMSPKSLEKAKQLVLEYEDCNKNNAKSSSPAAADSVSFKNRIIDVSSAMKPKRWNKVKILSRVKRILALQKSHGKGASVAV